MSDGCAPERGPGGKRLNFYAVYRTTLGGEVYVPFPEPRKESNMRDVCEPEPEKCNEDVGGQGAFCSLIKGHAGEHAGLESPTQLTSSPAQGIGHALPRAEDTEVPVAPALKAIARQFNSRKPQPDPSDHSHPLLREKQLDPEILSKYDKEIEELKKQVHSMGIHVSAVIWAATAFALLIAGLGFILFWFVGRPQ